MSVRATTVNLNTAQRHAAEFEGGPLLIIAGAGTGKTFTLASRVAHLLESGTKPERILLLTFSRRAAREMLARVEKMTGETTVSKVWGGTFHAMGNRLLRIYGRAIGVNPDFTVLDRPDNADLMNLIRGELHLDTRERRFPRKETLADIYSRTVNAGNSLREIVERHFPWCTKETPAIAQIFTLYAQRKRSQNVLDYDDLLLYWNALAESSAGGKMAEQFDCVLVDEYQDSNYLQAQLLRSLHRKIANITVVGDDAQAIYSFRSATVGNILQFPQQFASAHVVKLEQNFRSTSPLLNASNAVIALSPQRHEKTLWSEREGNRRPLLITSFDETEQASAVCASILESREQGIPLVRQAVLFRASHHSDLVEVELARRNIPFVKYGGLKFLEAAHVKDAIAILRVLENPLDEVSWFRVLQLIEGVGPAGARKITAELVARSVTSLGPLQTFIDAEQVILAADAETYAALRAVLSDCAREIPPASQIQRIREFCEPVFERLYSSADSRLKDIEQLENLASAYPSRARFLTDLTLDPPNSTSDLAGPPLLDEDYVILSTIHSAKGCEWDVVRIIHAADGMIPSDMATGDGETIEEERRLFYVAMTRARNMLEIYFPLRHYRHPRGMADPHSYAQRTRFIPDELLSYFGERTTYVERNEDRPAAQISNSSNAVDEFLRGLWGNKEA